MSAIVFGHRLNGILKRNLALLRNINFSVLKGMQLPTETKNTGHNKFEPKDTLTGPAAANTAPKPAGVLKSQKENMPRCDVTRQ